MPELDLSPEIRTAAQVQGAWLKALRRYLAFIVPGHLLWEFAHLPLYTIWHEARTDEIVFAVLHCTAGDILIAITTLVGALVFVGSGWPIARVSYRRVAAITIVFGVAYTIFSEWLNIEVREAWAYSELMPVVPFLDAGLSPLLQWVLLPLGAFWWARPRVIDAEQRTRAPG